jgi:hypothetical protein
VLGETEEQATFDQLADARWEEFLWTGEAVAWKDAAAQATSRSARASLRGQ